MVVRHLGQCDAHLSNERINIQGGKCTVPSSHHELRVPEQFCARETHFHLV